MKIVHDNIDLIESWLDSKGLPPCVDDYMVRRVYQQVLESGHKIKDLPEGRQKWRAYRMQYDYVRRDLLKLMYKKNGFSAKGIKPGYVYAITNPAWPGYVKIGVAIDVYDRLNSYQTSSPLRDYNLEYYYFCHERLKEESDLHSMFGATNEWCKVSLAEILEMFKKRHNDHRVHFPRKVLGV